MKVILVDAVNTFVIDKVIDKDIFSILESYDNRKIILTNANEKQIIEFGLVDLPYQVFSLKNNPNKIDSNYFLIFLKSMKLNPSDCLYFEHNILAVRSAESVGIKSFYFDKDKRDIHSLKSFLDSSL